MVREILIYATLWLGFFTALWSWRKWSPQSPAQFWKMGKVVGFAAVAAAAAFLVLAALVLAF